jgi:membrane-bound inhibitor of C-type lysozyme
MINTKEKAWQRTRGAILLAVASVTGATLLTACVVGSEVTALPARIDYVCANNRVLSVARVQGQRVAGVRVDGRDVVLTRSESAAQEKYSDGRYALYLEGEQAMLEDQGRVIYGPCVSPVPLPTYYR